MHRLATFCIVSALLIGLFIFPQYATGSSVSVWSYVFVVPVLGLLAYSEVNAKPLKPLFIGITSGWFVASVMAEQWLAPFPQVHWLRSFGIDTTPIAIHLFSVFALLGAVQLKYGWLKKAMVAICLVGICAYWVLPQQFLFENITPLRGGTQETLVYSNGELTPMHWRREVFTDPPWREFPSIAYNEYGLASIGHGMGLQMDPDNESRRKILYEVQLTGSISVIYLRLSVIIAALVGFLSSWLRKFEQPAVWICMATVGVCYVLPPILNVGLSLMTMGFAEAINETGRYVFINMSLSLAALGPLLLRLKSPEAS
jgi:hypothetical protein